MDGLEVQGFRGQDTLLRSHVRLLSTDCVPGSEQRRDLRRAGVLVGAGSSPGVGGESVSLHVLDFVSPSGHKFGMAEIWFRFLHPCL